MASTVHDVARLAGVSAKTVSNVVNDYPYIRDTTRQKVLEAIAVLDYRPNLAARSLRLGRTGVIGLVVPRLRNPYFGELADALMQVAARHGLSVLVEQLTGDREQELHTLRGWSSRATDGLLYSMHALRQPDLALLDLSVPLVLLGDCSPNGRFDHVTIQNTLAMRTATEHLLGLGRTRLLALGAGGGTAPCTSRLRTEGFTQALRAAGLPVDERLLRPVSPWDRAAGAQGVHDALAEGLTFDGVVAFNDALGLGALRALQDVGLRVPQDVAVIGFDDLDESRFSVPALSTVDPGRPQIAERAVETLLERIALRTMGPAALPPRTLDAPFRVVQRESTALPPL